MDAFCIRVSPCLGLRHEQLTMAAWLMPCSTAPLRVQYMLFDASWHDALLHSVSNTCTRCAVPYSTDSLLTAQVPFDAHYLLLAR